MQLEPRAKPRLHYAWIIAGVTFLVLLGTAGVRATPGILMIPLEQEFGWTRATISVAISINIALFGLIGPFAASLMARYGMRRVLLFAVGLLCAAVFLTTFIHHPWQLILLWGVLVGTGTGFTAMVLAAIVVNRWFEERRGLVLGALSAANATGQLVFLPMLALLATHRGWRSAAVTVAMAAGVIFLFVWIWMRDYPSDLNLVPYGARADLPPSAPPVSRPPLRGLVWAAHYREFWILAGTFFICGATTIGLIGTHLIPACVDHGIPEVRAAGLLAVMGIFDIAGTTMSGWLTDRFNGRYLLFCYYAMRGVALMVLPYSLEHPTRGLSIFAVFYGLDWVATVPPTVRLTTNTFGKENVGMVYGWIAAAHQIGASLAAFAAASIRTYMGDYRNAFWISGVLCLVAAAVLISTRARASALEPKRELAEELV